MGDKRDRVRETSPARAEDESLERAPDGVDVTLIRWMLSLSPRDRLRVLEEHVGATLRLRERMS